MIAGKVSTCLLKKRLQVSDMIAAPAPAFVQGYLSLRPFALGSHARRM